MPNWVYNSVTITTPDGRPVSATTLEQIRTAVASPGAIDTDKRLLDFERIVPTGTDGNGDQDDEVQRRAWGVKTGACYVNETQWGWKFSTPWSVPGPVMVTLSARFPNVRFVLTTTFDQGAPCCKCTYENGEQITTEFGKMNRDKNGRSTPYHGWRNYETWNVAQWLTADEDAYEVCKRHHAHGNQYADVVLELNKQGITDTPDGVSFWAPELDTNALDELLRELP